MRPNWFVGIPVYLPTLENMLHNLPKSCRGFHPHDLHMTVAFLGSMQLQWKPNVIALMKTLIGSPLTITLGGVRALPSPRKASAFCLEIDMGHQVVCDWMASWRSPLITGGRGRQDKRPPLPHITIARPLRKAGEKGREEGLAWLRGLEIPETQIFIDRLALYTWAENRDERLFQIVFEHVWT